VAEGISKGFLTHSRAHEYADVADSARDWVEEHYLNLPANARPERTHLRPFANFFATYVVTSFDIVEQPGMRRVDPCGCGCRFCSYMIEAPRLQTKKLSKRDKQRALGLMVDRILQLAIESDIALAPELAERIATDEKTRRFAGYSAYGHWLIKRLDGLTDGPSILALWREIAWNKSGSPRPKFMLKFDDFANSEQRILQALELPSD